MNVGVKSKAQTARVVIVPKTRSIVSLCARGQTNPDMDSSSRLVHTLSVGQVIRPFDLVDKVAHDHTRMSPEEYLDQRRNSQLTASLLNVLKQSRLIFNARILRFGRLCWTLYTPGRFVSALASLRHPVCPQ